MIPTELSLVENLDKIADEAISSQQQMQLAGFSMIPWTRTLQHSRVYPVPKAEDIMYYVLYEILPGIFCQAPKEMTETLGSLDVVLSEAFKNSLEEAAKIGSVELRVGHSDLGIPPIEFILYSDVREISPFFAKYWRYQKSLKRERGFADMDLDFYKFSGQLPAYGVLNCGGGLSIMLALSKDMGFYKSEDNTLLTYLLIDN